MFCLVKQLKKHNLFYMDTKQATYLLRNSPSVYFSSLRKSKRRVLCVVMGTRPEREGKESLFGMDAYAPTVDMDVFTGADGGPWQGGRWDGLILNHFAFDFHSSGLSQLESSEYWQGYT